MFSDTVLTKAKNNDSARLSGVKKVYGKGSADNAEREQLKRLAALLRETEICACLPPFASAIRCRQLERALASGADAKETALPTNRDGSLSPDMSALATLLLPPSRPQPCPSTALWTPRSASFISRRSTAHRTASFTSFLPTTVAGLLKVPCDQLPQQQQQNR
jgi:hypothetical protein